MHRGSSKGDGPVQPPPETLPLSASPPSGFRVTVDLVRAGETRTLELEAVPGSPLRGVLRRAGIAPEGVAALVDEASVPLDLPVTGAMRVTVIPTFSGG